jgi:hypothetical protein
MTTPEDRKSDELKPPPLPEVTRLNRNVLLVAAMGVAVIVLAVTHVVRSDRDVQRGNAGAPRVEAGAVGSFLNDSARTGEGLPVPPPAYPELAQSIDTLTAALTGSQSAGASSYAGYDLPPKLDPREEAFQRALRAGLRVRDGSPRNYLASLEAFSGSEAVRDPEGAVADGPPLRDITVPPAMRRVEGSLPRRGYQEFLEAAADEHEPPTYANSRVIDPVSEYQIMAGTVLPVMLVTAMNSDMPGEILAQISRNIFDSQQHHLLIPRGTKVIGRYDNQIALGQSRVLIAWTRLIFPDGRSISLPGLPTKDLQGASGMHSEVDNHYGRLYGQAVLLSIIGAGAQLSQAQQSNVLVPSSAGQVAAGALGQELSRVSIESIRRSMDVRPTLQVKAGTPFYIFLERDLVLESPYVDRRQETVSDSQGAGR